MGDYKRVPDEDGERAYDGEPELLQVASEEVRPAKQLEQAYPDRPGR